MAINKPNLAPRRAAKKKAFLKSLDTPRSKKQIIILSPPKKKSRKKTRSI